MRMYFKSGSNVEERLSESVPHVRLAAYPKLMRLHVYYCRRILNLVRDS